MQKCSNQKLKLLHVMKIITEQTDEKHPISVDGIIKKLQAVGISAERKSIYDDIKALYDFGLDIKNARTKPSGYYLASREFELPELKLLVDSVQASKFITEKKSITLIQKLTSLSSKHEANLLKRQVYVHNRIKSMNESIYYNVDGIHGGINQDKKICFKYFSYDLNKNKHFRKNSKVYCVSPFALTWDDENYYMIAYDSEVGIIKHYRVDKMESISIAEETREGKSLFSEMDMAVYSKRNFNMFGGEEQKVKIEFHESLVGVVIDKFGKDTMLCQTCNDNFCIYVDVAVSPVFFSWVFTFGNQAKIISPQSVVEEAKKRLNDIAQQYQQPIS